RQVISNGAAFLENGTQSIDMTLGETIIFTLNGAGGLEINQGFQQRDLMLSTSTHQAEPAFRFEIYPNPTPNHIHITSDADELLLVTVYDLKGSPLLQQALAPPISSVSIDLQGLPAAPYFIYLTNANGQAIRTFSIQKINQ
ncbi:MAG: T9SS type A sorting domain-containing protein, partial [Bacteroidota bacterium]